MAGGGFGRADGEPAAGAEHGLDGGQFALVAYLGGGGVGIQVLHRGTSTPAWRSACCMARRAPLPSSGPAVMW